MTKLGDSQTKKTLHELAKEFPEKNYKELEKYRNADRVEEAVGIGHNHPPEKTFKKACTLGEMRKDRSYPDLAEVLVAENEKLKKRAQEAEGELSILKGIETNRVKEAQARCDQLQNELDRIKLDNNNLYTRVADALEVNEHHHNLNGKLQVRIAELEDDNQKISKQVEDQLERVRKAGL